MIYDLLLLVIVLVWSLQKIIDKHLLKHSDPDNFTKWSFIAMFLLMLPFTPYVNLLSLKAFLIIALLAILNYANSFLTNHAMKKEEVSRVMPLGELSGLFAILLAIILLGEKPSGINIIGAFLMGISSVFIAFEKPFEGIKQFIANNKVTGIVLAGAFISGLNIVISKEILLGVSALSLVFFRRIITASYTIPKLKKPDIKNWPLFILSKAISTFGLVGFWYVISKQDIFLTTPILAIQPLLVLLFSHKLLEEKKYFKARLLATLILISGYILLKI